MSLDDKVRRTEERILSLYDENSTLVNDDDLLLFEYARRYCNLGWLTKENYFAVMKAIRSFQTVDRMLRKVREKARRGEYGADSAKYIPSLRVQAGKFNQAEAWRHSITRV